MRVLAIDPGKTIGWCIRTESAIEDMGQVLLDDFPDFLEGVSDNPPDALIYERYYLWGHKALQQSGSRMEASQAIGQLKQSAKKWPGCRLVEQGHQDKDQAALWFGINHKKGAHKDTHSLMALLHANFFLVKEGLIKF